MANEEHLAILRQRVEAWNAWRAREPDVRPDLREALLTGADLRGAKLIQADLLQADLYAAKLIQADLTGADLRQAALYAADLRRARLGGARLHWAQLAGADLRGARLGGADLTGAILVETRLERATLTGCRVYGTSVWNVTLDAHTQQTDLVITPSSEPTITVDNLKVAQFVYLLLHNEEIRHVIDTITSKVVLLLGRFTDKRKAVLDALRDALRQRDYLPVLFDFDKPTNRNLTETITLLARTARFVVADLTDPRSIPQELGAIIPHQPSVPVQPLLENGADLYAMFESWIPYPWVLPICRYRDAEALLGGLTERVILPAERKAKKLQPPPARRRRPRLPARM